ncbi:MAG: hypothetical protein CEE42_13715 [Promethearchaeota archaeon Loki_b31]|jgi:hypothetical protein|nr:MAG: hypothetical protein CEE42_13715 [Candidatus Lokiarchaeota archaeon Loki_b31]
MYKDLKSERISIYFDCICGTICSISALFGIFFFSLPGGGVTNFTSFVIGITFWFGYLFLSLFVIGVGIYTYYKAKNFSSDGPVRKKLKTPIIS